MHEVEKDKEFAARSCKARGYKNFKEWAKDNRKWAGHFRKIRPDLSSRLDSEYISLIRPNL